MKPIAIPRKTHQVGGVARTWSNLDTRHPVRRFGCRILEQKGTEETKRESRFQIGTSLSSFPSVQNQAQSSLIKPNPYRYQRAAIPAATTIYCGLTGRTHNPWWFLSSSATNDWGSPNTAAP